MLGNETFNATVCTIGIAILLIHVVNLLLKKNKRKDENRLLVFLLFTVVHFSTYLAFTFLKINYASEPFIMGFYTTFYIFNNVEILLFFIYVLSYLQMADKAKRTLFIINLSLFSVFVVLDIVNIFTGMFFNGDGGTYNRNKLMIISQSYQLVMFAITSVITLFNKKLVIREKIAFAFYCLIPLVAIILQNQFKGYAIAYLSIIVAIEVLFFFVNVSKNIQLAEEQEKNKDAQIRIMMSQIQPHFVYNALSSISTLISINPPKAQKALDSFTEYLRHNIAALTATKLIPFEEELKHIKTYVSLEEVRFNDRINVEYDIYVKDFYVPPLSLQPIVENAIKHGILKKLEGGKVIFKTYETDSAYIVEISDDGVGFDANNFKDEDNKHFGINNIKHRIKNMCNGDIAIESEVGKGAKVTVTFYKKD